MAWSLQTSTAFTEQEFDQWTKILEERTGISLNRQQQAFLQTQIFMRMRELGFNQYSDYYQKLTKGLWGKAEWSVLVDRLMVKETSFFRHRQSFDFVRGYLQTLINNQKLNDSFDVWSVGCSTGEEPYSLAMVINDCFELARLNPYFGVFATDISMPALSKARTGIYGERKVETLTENERLRYMTDLGDGRFKINDKLQERVCFSQGSALNISSMPMEKMDVIFCQNLLIYFRRWRRHEILNDLVERLKPGGVLLIGLGEAVDWKHESMEKIKDQHLQGYRRL